MSFVTQSVEDFLKYPFETDESYQQGLAGILANGSLEGKSDAERCEILQRSRLFYYNRMTGGSLTQEDVQHHRVFHSADDPPPSVSSAQPAAESGESRTLSFAELKELIESGKTDQIPNNRHIPNGLHTAHPSISTASVRKKPWELAQETVADVLQENNSS